MTDYTAKNVILKDANGGYLIPYTEKLERDLSDITSAGSQAILNNVHTDGNVVQAWSSSIVPTANKTLVSYYVSSELKFYLNTTGVNTSTAPSSDTTNWMEVSLGGGSTYTAGTGIDITNDVISAVALVITDYTA